MSPDLSTASGTISKPPATGDSNASSGGGTTSKVALPSIAGSTKIRAHPPLSKPDDEGHGGALPSIGGATGVSDGSDGDNLPPIGIGKVQGRKAPSVAYASGRNKQPPPQQRAGPSVANAPSAANKQHRSQNNLPKYKPKYSGHA